MITQQVAFLITLISKRSKLLAIDLYKQQVLHADTKAIQQINFNANLGCAGNTKTFFV